MEKSEFEMEGEDEWIGMYLNAASKKNFTRKEVLDLIERHGVESSFSQIFETLRTKLLKQDPSDPEVRLAYYTLNSDSSIDSNDKADLENIIEEATKRNDHKSRQKAEKLLKLRRNAPPPIPIDGSPRFLDDDPNEDVDDPPDVDQMSDIIDTLKDKLDPDKMNQLLDGLPFDAGNTIRKIIKDLEKASADELADMRSSPPLGMPPLLFEMLVQIAIRSRANKIPAPPQSRKSSPPLKRDLDDPNQLPLF